MIAVDTNILISAFVKDAPEHERARAAIASLTSGRWGLPGTVPFEFVAVTTSARMEVDPADACAAIDIWLGSPGCVLLSDPPDAWDRARPLIEAAGISGPQVHDARIAATCLAHGVNEFWTNDDDFQAFPRLRLRNPLAG